MGASEWSYLVPYQLDLNTALTELQAQVFDDGAYWWAGGEIGHSAREYPNRPTTLAELWNDERVQEDGTHSILDMQRVVTDGEEPDYGTVVPATAAELLQHAATERPTRAHIDALTTLPPASARGYCRPHGCDRSAMRTAIAAR